MQKPDVDLSKGFLDSDRAAEFGSSHAHHRRRQKFMIILRLLYAHIGQPYCPKRDTDRHATTSDIVDKILGLPPRTRVMLLAPVVREQKVSFGCVERSGERASCGPESMELSS